jgi:4-diphosphocytidyl-2-C-methyl-D-erythritol kinase
LERLTLLAPAKLNLRLLVGPLGRDRYHPITSLMVALDGLADTVRAAPGEVRRVSCPGIEGPANLAWRALDALEEEVGRALPLEVVIEKRIPARAGLGGGSSDAAATLLAADRLHGLGLGAERLEHVAARVGADVPFFIRGGCQWARGRGERLQPAERPRFAAVLAMPAIGLSTPAVYAAFDRGPTPPPPPAHSEPPRGFAALAGWVRNDLWAPALALAPALGATARALSTAGARTTVLCGSGSCVAGLFPDRASAEAGALLVPGGVLGVVV